MSYHLGYGQADWFFGTKPKYQTAEPTGKVEGQPTPRVLSPEGSPPEEALPPPPAEAPPEAPAGPPAPMMEEEEEGLNLVLIAGVGALALTGILIYFKFSGGSDEDEAIEAPAPKATPEKAKPKTIKVEITTDEEA